jgi:hypothetical protein
MDPPWVAWTFLFQTFFKLSSTPRHYFECGVLPAVGGQGALALVEVPGVVELLPEVDGVEEDDEEVEDEESGLDDVDDEPVLGLELPAVPGIVPHGEVLLGVLPGVVFGFIVDGCVLLPGVVEFGVVAPGTGDDDVGVDVLPGGVDVLAGGVAVPGVCAPLLPEVPAGEAPPEGALCATTQTAHERNIVRKVSFAADIWNPPALNFLSTIFFDLFDRRSDPSHHTR